MDRVYVYLMEKDVPICYWRGKLTDFLDPNPKYQWIPLKNDPAIGKIEEEHHAGMI